MSYRRWIPAMQGGDTAGGYPRYTAVRQDTCNLLLLAGNRRLRLRIRRLPLERPLSRLSLLGRNLQRGRLKGLPGQYTVWGAVV